MSEKLDFSKPEDQKNFEGLLQDKKDKIKDEAEIEAEKMKKKVKSGEARDYSEAERIVEGKKEGNVEFEKELSPEIIEKIIKKVQNINKIGTVYKSISTRNLEKILEQGFLGSKPGESIPEDSRQEWAENVRKKKRGQVFFNIIGVSKHESEDDLTMKTASFNLGSPTIIFDLNKYSPDFPLKEGGAYGYSEDKQKINTFKYSQEGYEKPDMETARKYYNERQQYLKLHPEYRGPIDDLEFNEENWQLFLEPINKDFGFNLSFRAAPRLFKGIVITPERKLNTQEIKDRLEELENWYKNKLQEIEKDRKYRERVDVGYIREIYEQQKSSIINNEITTEELDPEKRVEFAKKIDLKMIRINEGKLKNLIPIYDYDGNLLWPKQMSYEEVKKFVAERDKKN